MSTNQKNNNVEKLKKCLEEKRYIAYKSDKSCKQSERARKKI